MSESWRLLALEIISRKRNILTSLAVHGDVIPITASCCQVLLHAFRTLHACTYLAIYSDLYGSYSCGVGKSIPEGYR